MLLAAALLAGLAAAPAPAANEAALTAPVRAFIDAFNAGDAKRAYAQFEPGTIAIVDEFAPHQWVGPRAPQAWAAEYDRHAKRTGVTDGRVTYGPATRIEVEGDLAYVIIPTVYLYKENGRPIAEEGSITSTVHHGAKGWKMRGWTWSGVKPHPAR